METVAKLVPRTVLHRRREPHPPIDLLQLLFLSNFFPRGNLRILRLGRTREIIAIYPRRRDPTAQWGIAFRAAVGRRVVHAVHRLVNDQAGRALIFVQRHDLATPKP